MLYPEHLRIEDEEGGSLSLHTEIHHETGPTGITTVTVYDADAKSWAAFHLTPTDRKRLKDSL